MNVPAEITQAIPEACPFGGQQLLGEPSRPGDLPCLDCSALHEVWHMYADALCQIAELKKELAHETHV